MPAKTGSPVKEIVAECLAGRVRLLNRTITSLYDDLLRPAGVTAGQLNMLVMVASEGPLSPGELAKLLKMEKSTLSRNLARLRKRGWVRITTGESGRTQNVEIDPSGRERIARAHPLWKEAQHRIEQLLGTAGAQSLREAFDSARSPGRLP